MKKRTKFEKQITSETEITFVDLRLYINEGKATLYDEINSYRFNNAEFPHKSSTIKSKTFLQPLVQKYFRTIKHVPL